MSNYVFLGDVHSQLSKLSQAVYWIQQNVDDYHIIQGGDLFDSRTDESDSLGVYNLIRSLGERVTVLNSNHHYKLYRVLTRDNNNFQHMDSLMRTMKDFGFEYNADLKQEVIQWLSTLPYGVVIKTHELEYRVCHAYWYKKLYVPQRYENPYYIQEVSSKAKGQMLFGISRRGEDGNSERILWWESKDPQYFDEFVRVSFHYHTISLDPFGKIGRKHIILDGSCGDENGKLYVYNTTTHECVAF